VIGSKIISTSLVAATTFAMTASMALAMGGRSSRPDGGSSSGFGGSSSSSSLSTSGTTPLSVGEGVPGGGTVTSVPEIDASTGLLALAAVLAVVAFVWERNRRLRA
jgi:hypothetical protein